MANRLEEEFPEMDLRWTPPLIGPDGLQHQLGREIAWRQVAGREAALRSDAREPRTTTAGLWQRFQHAVREAGHTGRRHPALTAGCR